MENEYFHKLADVFNKYSHTCHSTIKMKHVDVTPNTSIDFEDKK